ncbi:DUF5979 domain-containing protein [Leucobacter celer]|uniref:DUF5979 domain-containing protein n=1 Tax=Leucobacter celer TaxID=668625 RepID=UPI0006A7EE6B|nr:DUF5979 domain-containing protein [Leucobacter celer]
MGIGLVLALFAVLLVPAGAWAAPGDLAHGTVYSDANKNGALDAGAAGDADVGLEGVTVNVLDADGNLLASTVTAADGTWAISESAVTGTPARIEIVTADANGDVYGTYTTTNAENHFARSSAPNRAVADLTGTDVELNALVYPVWKLDLKLADDPNGVGGKSILTGAPTWDPNSAEDGFDDSTSNTRVRSADIVAFNWSLTAESEDGSIGDTFADAVFEQTILFSDGAVANFVSIPAICDQAQSTIVAQPSGTTIAAKADPPAGTTSVVLSCVLGEMGVSPAPSAYILSTLVQPSATSPNGSSFETESRFYAVDGNGAATAQPAPGPEVPPIEITAAPRYDLEKTPGDRTYTGYKSIDGEPVRGIFTYYNLKISTDRKVGVEAFEQPLTFEDSFWGVRSVAGPDGEPVGSPVTDLKWYIDLCDHGVLPGSGINPSTTVYSRIGYSLLATEANSARHSGNCAYERTGAADTGNYTFTLQGIDTSGISYPTQTIGGQSLAAGPYYVASYRVRVFVPLTEIDRMQGAATDGVGELSIFNRVGDFDPESVSGASNFGSGNEPGSCLAGPSSDQATNCDVMEDGRRSNNVAGPSTLRISAGSWGKYLNDATTGWANGVASLPNLSVAHGGDGQVQPGQTFSSRQVLNNTGTDMTRAEMCDVFDRTMLKLAPLAQDVSATNPFDAGRYSAVLRYRNGTTEAPAEQQARQGDWEIKYGTVDLTGDDPNTGVFDTATDRYEGDWSNQKAAASGSGTACGSADITWYDSPEDVPGGVDAVNVVWAKTAPGYVVQGGDIEYWYLAFEQRDTYNGGPHAGETIPSGTVAVNFGNVSTSTFATAWAGNGYMPGAGMTGGTHQTGENGSTYGDRWTVARADLRIQKRTIDETVDGEASSGVSNYGVTGAAVAGRPVVWELTPTLTAASDEPAPVAGITVTDTLPEYVVYDEAATQALATAGGFPAPSSATVNPDGTTTVVWSLGIRTPNEDLPVLKVATRTDPMSPPNTTAVNEVLIAADGVPRVSRHFDDHTIRIEQSGQVQLKKSVDRRLDLQDDDQRYTLEVKNFSETLMIQAPTIYDALPYGGDATNDANVQRTPPSDYAGTNRLNAAPVATDFDGATPRAGVFYYTTVPGSEIPQRQQDDTDPSIWSTTFTPNATGFKFVSATPLATTADASGSGIKIAFQTDQAENEAGDVYTNRFTAISPTLDGGNQLLTSNTVSVRVLGFSLGDFIWFDIDGDGAYTAGTDRPAPEGVTVQVRDAAGTVVDTAATLGGAQEGRWIVNDLPAGDYYVTIPASEFADGGLLAGAVAAPGAVSDPNGDVNEDGDHHAIADGVGVRSSGLITLSADTAADPITGAEPTGENAAGLSASPLTTDDFTNLTLDLALTPAAKFTVAKAVDGDAAQYGTGNFIVQVACTNNDAAVPGYPRTVTLKGGEFEELFAPLGSHCTAAETGMGGATSVAIDPSDGLTLDVEDGEFTLTVTNTFDAGQFKIRKEVRGVGGDLGTDGREFTFAVTCSFNGEDGVFETTIALADDGSGVLTSEPITGLPVGASCTITETDSGGADETPAPVQLVIEQDPQTEQIAGFVNEYSAGAVQALKELAGAAQDDTFITGLDYEVQLDCAIERDGALLTLYSGKLWLTPGTAVIPEVGGVPVKLPVGAHCWMQETADQGADDIAVNFTSYEDAAVVTAGAPDELQTLELAATNTFDRSELTVSKKVVGPGTGEAYDFELACTYPVRGEDGVEQTVEYPLAEGDASFGLRDGENKTVSVLAGVTCKVVETNVPEGATVTIVDSDGATAGGTADGELSRVTGSANTVEVTNTFTLDQKTSTPPPTMPITGAAPLLGVLWSALGLLLTGAALLLTRRRQAAQRGDAPSET